MLFIFFVDEPSHNDQNCGSIMTSYKWRDHRCHMKYYYICEESGEFLCFLKLVLKVKCYYNYVSMYTHEFKLIPELTLRMHCEALNSS